MKEKKQIMQMDSQWVGDPAQIKVREIIRSAKLGQITKIQQNWNDINHRWHNPNDPDVAAIREEDTDWNRWLLGKPGRTDVKIPIRSRRSPRIRVRTFFMLIPRLIVIALVISPASAVKMQRCMPKAARGVHAGFLFPNKSTTGLISRGSGLRSSR